MNGSHVAASIAPFDEAVGSSGVARDHYAPLLRELENCSLGRLRVQCQADFNAFGAGFDGDRFQIDPVPRLFTSSEWDRVEMGVAQRLRALNAFLADAYSERSAVDAGVLPARVLDQSAYYEPLVRQLAPPPRAAIAGLDLVRDETGTLRSLEDNLRTPSGLAFFAPARETTTSRLGAAYAPLPIDAVFEQVDSALRAVDPSGAGDPSIALLSDGPGAPAYDGHRVLAGRLGIPVVTPDQLYVRRARLRAWIEGRSLEIGVVYRRTDEDRLSHRDGALTPLGELLFSPLKMGTLACANSFGTGLADDKGVHTYSSRLIRFYLDEEPILTPVHAYDLGDNEQLEAAIERLDQLVVKGRGGSGGEEVWIADEHDRRGRSRIEAAIRGQPGAYVAQEKVTLSTHPTVIDGELAPRHIDLRPFAFDDGRSVTVAPGGLTRFAPEAGEMMVNAKRGGGGKDTWVLAEPPGHQSGRPV